MPNKPKGLRPQPRVIPNFAMDKPWTEPLEQIEQEALASSVLIGVPSATASQVTAYMQQFAGDAQAYSNALAQAQA